MSKQAHMLSDLFGQQLVSTLPINPRRKSADELKAMAIEDRLLYERHHPISDAERQDALDREDRDHGYDTTGEVDARDLRENHPPADWGAD